MQVYVNVGWKDNANTMQVQVFIDICLGRITGQ